MFNITPLPGYAIFKQYIMNGGSGDPGSEKALLFLEKVRKSYSLRSYYIPNTRSMVLLIICRLIEYDIFSLNMI